MTKTKRKRKITLFKSSTADLVSDTDNNRLCRMWHIPVLYILIHVAIGFVAYYSTPVLVGFLAYQVLQYAFNVRVFALEGVIRPGNSLAHTLIKLGQTAVGYAIAFIYDSDSHSDSHSDPYPKKRQQEV